MTRSRRAAPVLVALALAAVPALGGEGPAPLAGPTPPTLVDTSWPGTDVLAFSPDGRWVAMAAGGGRIEIRDLADGRLQAERRVQGPGAFHSGQGPLAAAFDRGSERLWFVYRDGRLARWDLRRDELVVGAPVQDSNTFDALQPVEVLPSPGGRRVLVAAQEGYSGPGGWWLHDGDDLRLVAKAGCPRLEPGAATWIPGSDPLAFAVIAPGGVARHRGEDGAALAPFPTPVGRASRLAASPDGRVLAVGGTAPFLALLDASTGAEVGRSAVAPEDGPAMRMVSLAWDPTGSRVVGLRNNPGGQEGRLVFAHRKGKGAGVVGDGDIRGESVSFDGRGGRVMVRNVIHGVTAIADAATSALTLFPLPANRAVHPRPGTDLVVTDAGPGPWPAPDRLPDPDAGTRGWRSRGDGAWAYEGPGRRAWPVDWATWSLLPPEPSLEAWNDRAPRAAGEGITLPHAKDGLAAGLVLPLPAREGDKECALEKVSLGPAWFGLDGGRGAVAVVRCFREDLSWTEELVAWSDVGKPPTARVRAFEVRRMVAALGGTRLLVWREGRKERGVDLLRLPDLVPLGHWDARALALPGEPVVGEELVLGSSGREVAGCEEPGPVATCAFVQVDQKAACFADERAGRCSVWDLQDFHVATRLPHRPVSGTSPDGRTVVLRDPSTGGGCLYERSTGRCTPLPGDPPDPALPVYGWAFSPSGSWLVRARPSGPAQAPGRFDFRPATGGPAVSTWPADAEGTPAELVPGVFGAPAGRWMTLVRAVDGARLEVSVLPGPPPRLVARTPAGAVDGNVGDALRFRTGTDLLAPLLSGGQVPPEWRVDGVMRRFLDGDPL